MRNTAAKTYTEIFEQRGGAYDDAMRQYPDVRRHEFENIIRLADIRAGERVCDVPSGGGYISRYMPEGVHLTFVETSAAFHRLIGSPQPNSETVLAADNILPFPDGRFDKIVSMAGLHHNNDQVAFFKECARALKPGGALCIADAYIGSPPTQFLDIFVDRHNREGHKGLYLGPHTREAISSLGLRIEFADTIKYPWVFDSETDMAAYCMRLFGVEGVSVEEGIAGIKEHLDVRHVDGRVLMGWELYFIRAVKQP